MRLLNLPMFAAAVVGACFAEAVLASVPALPNFDANFTARQAEQSDAAQAKRGAASTSLQVPAPVQHLQSLSHGARVAQRDARLGKPTFLWGVGRGQAPQLRAYKRSADTAALARAYLYQQAPVLQVASGDIEQAQLKNLAQLHNGAQIARFTQKFAGYEVFGRSLNVLLNADKQLIATSGYFANTKLAAGQDFSTAFALSPADATARAFADMGGKLPAGVFSKVAERGAYQYLSPAASGVAANYALTRPARVKPLMFPLHDTLVPAYYVELSAGLVNSRDSEAYAYIVSARDGSLLYRKNLMAEATYTYRVYADDDAEGRPWDGPFGNTLSPFPGATPDTEVLHVYQTPKDVSLDSFIGASDPWLPAGASTLYGNNGYAYVDNTGNDGFDAQDYTTGPSAASTFKYTLTPDKQPTDATTRNRDVALVNAFYVVNWLHDLYYQHGFDEPAGVAQADNYDRGGEGGDRVLIEIQDGSGRNNANMSTPPDGDSPRMQMYLFDGLGGTYLDISAGPTTGKLEDVGTAQFGPQEFDVNSDVVLFQDADTSDGGTAVDGCQPATNGGALAGKIALIERGTCNFTVKVKNAQTAGAVAAIVVNNAGHVDEAGQPDENVVITMSGEDATINIGSLFLKNSDGQPLIDSLDGGGTVTAQLFRKIPLDRDGALDSGIVAHEYFHYVSNRLIGNGLGLVNNQGNSMGEGWSDFAMLLMITREADRLIVGNNQFQGAYSTGGYVDANAYFGIRRYPYSTDMAKNPLTFQHIEYGTELPPETTAPITHPGYLDGTLNNEVHAAGEVWANALWEGYVALLNDTARYPDLANAHSVMLDYLIGGLMLTPYAPTYTEARDAVLAVALANAPDDFDLLAVAFAKRGMGAGAISPPRFDAFHDDVVESFEAVARGAFAVTDITLTPQGGDGDSVWDVGETAKFRIALFNTGWTELTGVSATISTPGAVTIAGPMAFATLANPVDCTGACNEIEADTATATVNLTLNAATKAEAITLTATFADQAGVTEPIPVTFVLPVYFDAERDLAAPRNDDDMENRLLSQHDWQVSTPDADAQSWQLVAAEDTNPLEDAWGIGTVWYVPDNGVPSDATLITPPIVVGDSAFSVSFTHAFSFEYNDPDFAPGTGDEVYWDGGVVEITTDGGTTWQDVTAAGGSFATGYTGVLQATNPSLPSRAAFAGAGTGTETLSFGMALAGQTVQLRFRAGSDQAVGAPGWAIDNIVVTGALDPVFSSAVAQQTGSAPVVDAGPDQMVKGDANVTLDGKGSDAEGNVTYSWEQTAGTTVTLSDLAVAQPTFTAPASNGRLAFRLTVTDTVSRTAFDSVTIAVNSNPPAADAGANQTVDTGSNVTLNGSNSSDADGDALSYQWAQTSGTTVTLSNLAVAQPTFTAPSAATNLTFELTVTDEFGASDTDSVTVTVEKPVPANSGGGGGGGGGGSTGLLLLSALLGLGLLRRRGGAA